MRKTRRRLGVFSCLSQSRDAILESQKAMSAAAAAVSGEAVGDVAASLLRSYLGEGSSPDFGGPGKSWPASADSLRAYSASLRSESRSTESASRPAGSR